MGYCCLLPKRGELTVNSKTETNDRVRMGKESRWGTSQDGLLLFTPLKESNYKKETNGGVKMGYCCLRPERVKLTVNSRREINDRVKMGYCCLPPERVELTVTSNKETNGRVKMGCCCFTTPHPPPPPPPKESN